MNIKQENMVFEVIVQWIEHVLQQREGHLCVDLDPLCGSVSFELMLLCLTRPISGWTSSGLISIKAYDTQGKDMEIPHTSLSCCVLSGLPNMTETNSPRAQEVTLQLRNT